MACGRVVSKNIYRKEIQALENKELVRIRSNRTWYVWIGVVLGFVSRAFGMFSLVQVIMLVVAMVFILAGCYYWTRLKNRHWAFMLWGLIAPIGLLGLTYMRDKTEREATDETSEVKGGDACSS